jgi:hypothetical protein
MTFLPASAASRAKLRIFFSPSARSAEFLALKRDQGFSVKIMSPTSFTWKLDEEDYYHDESLIANSDSEAGARSLISGTLKTGVFVFFDATYKGSSSISQVAAGDTYYFTLSYNNGVGFDEADGNTAHQEVECSGQGTCDFATGKCACAKGYTGAACERGAYQFAQYTMIMACNDDPPLCAVECPNTCSGHGTCQAEARFVTDGNKAAGYSTATYKYSSAVDGKQQFGCKCDNGFRGADCSLSMCIPRRTCVGILLPIAFSLQLSAQARKIHLAETAEQKDVTALVEETAITTLACASATRDTPAKHATSSVLSHKLAAT